MLHRGVQQRAPHGDTRSPASFALISRLRPWAKIIYPVKLREVGNKGNHVCAGTAHPPTPGVASSWTREVAEMVDHGTIV